MHTLFSAKDGWASSGCGEEALVSQAEVPSKGSVFRSPLLLTRRSFLSNGVPPSTMMLTYIVSKARREEWCATATCRLSPEVSKVASDVACDVESNDATRKRRRWNRFGGEVGENEGAVGVCGD